MKTYFAILIFWLSIIPASAEQPIDRWLGQLDETIEQKQVFVHEKYKRLVLLRSALAKKETQSDFREQYGLYDKLYEEYSSFLYDSAFYYANQLLTTSYQLRNESYITQSKIKLSFTLLSVGMFKETLDTLSTIQATTLPENVRKSYFRVLARAYYDLSDYAQDNRYSTHYNKLGNHYQQAAIALMQPNTPEYFSTVGFLHLKSNQLKEAQDIYERLLRDFKLLPHQYAIDASCLGYIYQLSKQPQKAMEWLTKSAMADIQSTTKETVALRNLAELLYQQGDLKHAYPYVKLALEDAYFYGAKHRKIQISDILPIIEQKQLSTVEGQKNMLIVYSFVLTFLSMLLVVLSVIIFKQYKNLQQAKAKLAEINLELQDINQKLHEGSKIKEEYIGHFFNSISEQIAKVEKFKMAIARKLNSKRYDDITDIINNINLNEEREQLYASFDKIFLKIFPNFLDDFNALFKRQDHFKVGEKHVLSPELRIFALIRLGIRDTEKIAKILGYSVNTIYTYKTKIKNKSTIPNDCFEEKLLEIQVV